ncbi:hypothetical protein CEXT_119141 [Caerostris extrusa]|uniref:Uncharacterized protein n=1 Tax=Caerostris extrusa TaxID=172846 RepID=A0AAV4X7H7_CAEEX|nr:hypothetical protein CEXT_119141 [Caerostris extrusa]
MYQHLKERLKYIDSAKELLQGPLVEEPPPPEVEPPPPEEEKVESVNGRVPCIFGIFSTLRPVLKEGHLVALAPGGVMEAQFGDEEYSLIWGKRIGFAKVAIEAQVTAELILQCPDLHQKKTIWYDEDSLDFLTASSSGLCILHAEIFWVAYGIWKGLKVFEFVNKELVSLLDVSLQVYKQYSRESNKCTVIAFPPWKCGILRSYNSFARSISPTRRYTFSCGDGSS